MSAFREYLDGLERILNRKIRLRGGRRLAVDTTPIMDPPRAPSLLPWDRARTVRASEVGPRDVRRRMDGQLYGRPFAVWFPPRQAQPSGHVWVMACWPAEDSGTHRPEVLAVCRTCTDAVWGHLDPPTIVGPARCVLRAAEIATEVATWQEAYLADLWPETPGPDPFTGPGERP